MAAQLARRAFDDIVVQGYTSYRESTFCTLVTNEAVSLARIPPPPGKKSKEDSIVRFKNSKGVEVGRIVEHEAIWICKLLDLGMATFTGTAIVVPRKFQSGDSVVLTLTPRLARKAFVIVDPALAGKLGSVDGFRQEDETPFESMIRERKVALNRLFDKTNLQPVHESGPSGTKSKRELVEKYDADELRKKKRANSVVTAVVEEGDGVGMDGDGEVIDENALNLVYSRGNDANLPEMQPPPSFKLNLRGYQQQALHWMHRMEGGGSNEERDSSMHPLWEQYLFPQPPQQPNIDAPQSEIFYYNPYSGELSLEFPKATTKCRGGILADEMGLGKTIMVAALIETNTAHNSTDSDAEAADDIVMGLSDSETDRKPGIKPPPRLNLAPVSTQARLGAAGTLIKPAKLHLRLGTPHVTLIVAPMTLLDQWKNELERATSAGVMMYYGTNRADLREEIASGVSVVVTSYGTLISEFKKNNLGDEEGKGKGQEKKGKGKQKEISLVQRVSKERKALPKPEMKPNKRGLFGIEYFRVVLDEAHSIRNRATVAAKACYALNARRRWCLSGTPIVNRLEDLFSLLHFLRLEPWGNFTFYRTFVTVPFAKRDPKAIETIQIVLESVLLRREKSMLDRDGNPIIGLPEKHVSMDELSFSKDERVIYDALYRNAKSKFLGYEEAGLTSHYASIFATLMRLRLAVLHPSLVLKRLLQNLADAKAGNGRTKAERENDLDEAEIVKLITAYAKGESDGPASQVMQDLLDRASGDGEEDVQCGVCFEPSDSPVTLPLCGHSACRLCVLSHFAICEDESQQLSCPLCKRGPVADEDVLDIQRGTQTVVRGPAKPGKGYKASSDAGSSSQMDTIEIIDSSDEEEAPAKELTRVLVNVGKGKGKATAGSHDDDEDSKPERQARIGGDGFRSSTKITALVEYLETQRVIDPQLKAVVFSNFTSFLDLCSVALEASKFDFVRLDGTLSQKQRAKAVSKFTNSTKSIILIASLKAGGTGLNLVSATRVVLMDFWWNSASEDQACDRIHRFGQTREVYVKRFLLRDTIEGKIMSIQERKKRIVGSALAKGDDGKSKSDLAEDLRAIFED